MTNELKPCPFCGGEARIQTYRTFIDEYHGIGTKYYVECSECLADRHLGNLTEKEAIEAWNTRAERTCTYKWCKFGNPDEPNGCYEAWDCSNCGEIDEDLEEPPAFCLYCGAKVVE